MTEFHTIAAVKANQEKNLKAILTKTSDLKSGTSPKGDWTMKILTFEDTTGTLDMAAFNEEIKQFEKGFTYEIENFWWKKAKDGSPAAAVGQYAKITKSSASPPLPKGPSLTEETKPAQEEKENLSAISEPFGEFIDEEGTTLFQIDARLTKLAKEIFPERPVNHQQIGLYTKILYWESRKVNFKKASH